MQNQYTISEAKNKLPAIIHSVEMGPSVQLTRRGRPVAVLISVGEYEKLRGQHNNFWNALTVFRKKMAELQVVVSNEDFENLRDPSAARRVDLS
ncbi:MAG: type II toxin-antitoxin system prevent-host-death family antitoxin [Deltaproteobacteria bacterium]|nr:type II toxin-antitoxin system prevent-host-death family antitoxin [Deltaproteobacteria bacterium]